MVSSSMSNKEQVLDNVSFMKEFQPLKKHEKDLLELVSSTEGSVTTITKKSLFSVAFLLTHIYPYNLNHRCIVKNHQANL